MANASIAVYQAEWCPYSRRVREAMTELGLSFVSVPVPADPADREEMRRKTGTDEIPAVLFDGGEVLSGDAEEVCAALRDRFSERADADEHRRRFADAATA
jgi:glutaredoxin